MKLLFLILSIAFHTILKAQETPTGVVLYGHKQSLGMEAPIGIDYNACLVFNSKSSTYTFRKDSLEGGNIRKMQKIRKSNNNLFLIQVKTSKTGLVYYINSETNIIKSRDVAFYYVKDSIPKIDWKISTDTKQIGKFECVKALCSFRGRDYTAWFTTSIPLPFGPWKLQGLPGLILEAYDTKKEVYFYFKSIEYPSSQNLEIEVPDPSLEGKEWMSFEEYKKALIERHEIGVKRGLMLSEQSSLTSSTEHKIPMKNVFIEVFDEN